MTSATNLTQGAVVVFALLTIGALSERIAGSKPTDPLADLRAAIDRNNAAYLEALKSGDALAYALLFAEEGISMPGRGPTVRGRAGICNAVGRALKTVKYHGGEIRTLEAHLDGDVAVEFAVASEGTPRTIAGRYLTIWKRVGREWKIAVDSAQPGALA